MFKTSESTAKLDAALAKAQSQIKSAVKDKENPFFKSKYADLNAIWDSCREALNKNQISVTQWPIHSDDERLHLITRIAVEGEFVQCEMSLPVSKKDPQGYGSATTYARRFALASAIGVVADEDDDGNEASQPKKNFQQKMKEKDSRTPFEDRKARMFKTLCEHFDDKDEPAKEAGNFIQEILGKKYKDITSEEEIGIVGKAFKSISKT